MHSARTLVSLLFAALLSALVGCGGSSEEQSKRRPLSTQAEANHESIVQHLYVAYYGRPADPSGLVFWAGYLAQGQAPTTLNGVFAAYGKNPVVTTVIDNFGRSEESVALYGTDSQTIVRSIYRNLFNREPDDAGLTFYASGIDQSLISNAQAALAIANGAQGTDAATAVAKVRAAEAFSTSLSSPQAASYTGLQVNAAVRRTLATVGTGPTTSDASLALTGALVGEAFRLSSTGAMPIATAWRPSMEQRWTGPQLEGSVDYCRNRSIRWIAPIWFDANRDGVEDFILPISCYQGPDPLTGEKHNRQVIAAWKMWCSLPQGGFEDCTRKKFGSEIINATGTDSGGGNPYVHVMEEPFDINGDGFPDVWYALNRDDGRPGFDFSNSEDRRLLTQFCGPQPAPPEGWEWDCTRKARQSVLLSRSDGTYRVAFLPWSPTNTQAMVMLPNHLGGYDALSFNYGTWRAARLSGESFIDVTEEYRGYLNIDLAAIGEPYVRVFRHEGATYLVTAGQPAGYRDELIYSTNGHWGFTLWKWLPGVGLEISDRHAPTAANTFRYREQSGGSTVVRYGAVIRGLPVYRPFWHFFRWATLDPAEGPVLIASQESGTTGGRAFGAPMDPSATYTGYDYTSEDLRYRWVELSVVEAFHVRSGKLVPRMKSVVEGDVVWNTPALAFRDIDRDGWIDAYGMSGHNQAGRIYLNDGTGILRKRYTQHVIPEMNNADSTYRGSFGWTLRVADSSGRLSLVQFGTGFAQLPSWAGTTHTVPDVRILMGGPLVNSLPVHTPELLQLQIQNCLVSNTWIDQCEAN